MGQITCSLSHPGESLASVGVLKGGRFGVLPEGRAWRDSRGVADSRASPLTDLRRAGAGGGGSGRGSSVCSIALGRSIERRGLSLRYSVGASRGRCDLNLQSPEGRGPPGPRGNEGDGRTGQARGSSCRTPTPSSPGGL